MMASSCAWLHMHVCTAAGLDGRSVQTIQHVSVDSGRIVDVQGCITTSPS